MADDRSRRRTTVHTDIHDVRALTDTGAIPLPRAGSEQRDGAKADRPVRTPGAPAR